MRSWKFVVLLAAAADVAGAIYNHHHDQRADDGDIPELLNIEDEAPVVPGKYIVEFKHDTEGQQAVRSIESHHGFTVKRTFGNPDLFHGASVETKDDADAVNILTADDSIARVWPLRQIKLIQAVEQRNFSDIVDAVDYNIHGPTGVEALHKAGIYGEGATVAVVDTGIDYTHPAIGGGIGDDYTVIGGTDFVGDNCWPEEGCPLEPDENPMDYHGHGTHVSGIIAGQSKWFTGVAPKAKLLAYKVFTNAGWVTEDVLIEAFITAYGDGADVITASIGAISGWQDSPWALVADRIVEQGVVITIAAGNNGNFGPYFFSDGAAGRNVLGIASNEPDFVPQLALEVKFSSNGSSNDSRMGYLPRQGIPWPVSLEDVPVVHVGSGCNIPEDLDLSGKIALVERWFCSDTIKDREIAAAGGKYIFLFDPVEPDRDGMYIGDWDKVVFASLTDKDGQALAAALGEDYKISVTVPEEETIIGMSNRAAGTPSYFTSFGATYDHGVKPDIGAPGGNILSLYLNHGFAGMSGTSMATPYVAGVAALYIGKHGGRSTFGKGFGKMLSARILSSASHVTWANHLNIPLDSGVAASVAQTGNGLVNASKVLQSDTQLSFTKFALNDTHRFSRYQSLEITNTGEESVEYTFDVEAAGAFEALEWSPQGNPRVPQRKAWINTVHHIVAKAKMPSGTHRLAPGQTKKVEFIFEIPDGMNYTNMPVYSGKVLVRGSNGDELSVPYLGVGGNTGKEVRNRLWHRDYRYPRLYSGADDDTIEEKSSFTFDTSVDAQDFPKLQTVVNFGSPEIRWDIFEEGWREREWKYPPVPGKDGYVGSVAYWAGSNAGGGTIFDPELDDEDDVLPFPLQKVTRNVVYSAWWLGRLANGSDIAPGKYNMRVAALAPFGNPEASDNWDRFETPAIEVLAK